MVTSKKSQNKKTPGSVLVLSAHSDDFVLGAGGTIVNYVKEKRKVYCQVFSYGEMSHPWLKEDEVRRMRAQETLDASDVLECNSDFFDLSEGKFLEEAPEKKVVQKLATMIKRRKIKKVFTHSAEDPHPDHRAVHKLTLQAIESLKKSEIPEVYVYSIWNPVEFKTSYPTLYINIKEVFSTKLKALRMFPSQRLAIGTLTFMVFFRAMHNGIKKRMLLAEKFFRIK